MRNALQRDVQQVAPEGLTTPDPLNLFMNIPVKAGPVSNITASNLGTSGAGLEFESPVSDKGQYVVFKALMDCVVVMSACPQDLVKVNCMAPTEAHFMVEAA